MRRPVKFIDRSLQSLNGSRGIGDGALGAGSDGSGHGWSGSGAGGGGGASHLRTGACSPSELSATRISTTLKPVFRNVPCRSLMTSNRHSRAVALTR
jgi:hypothetical protein